MAELHSLEDWKRIYGTSPKLSKEEYEKKLRAQQKLEEIKSLLSEGKNTLGNIVKTVSPIASKIATRLRENYDTAVGEPRFGRNIREALGFNTGPLNPRGIAPSPSPYTFQNGYNVPFLTGPQYPREVFTIPSPAAAVPFPPQPQPQQPAAQAPAAAQGTQAPTSSSQVVFLYDDKDDKITEIMSEYPTAQEAEVEVARLRKQGLPAFYAAKGEYINNGAKLKS